MDHPRYRRLAALCLLPLVVAACGSDADEEASGFSPSGPSTVIVELRSPLPLSGAKLLLAGEGSEPHELLLVEDEGRWRGSREGLSPGQYEVQALLNEGDGWVPAAGRVSLELPAGEKRMLMLFFDRSEGLVDPRAPQMTPLISTRSSEEGTLIEVGVEMRAGEGAAEHPLSWSMAAGGSDDCAAAATWVVDGEERRTSIAGRVEDGGRIDATLFLPHVAGMDRCMIEISVTDGEGSRKSTFFEVSTAKVPIDLTIEE